MSAQIIVPTTAPAAVPGAAPDVTQGAAAANDGQLALPFADYELISSMRAQRILGVGPTVMHRLLTHRPVLFDSLQRGPHGRHLIRYWSLVAYLDRVRDRHGIPDRRPPLMHPGARYRDVDLLPFPLTDTVDTIAAGEVMMLGTRNVLDRIESGAIEAYRLEGNGRWRISRRSLAAYIQSWARVR